MGLSSSTSKSKENDRAEEMMEDLKSTRDTLTKAAESVTGFIQRIEDEQRILGTASEILNDIDQYVRYKLAPDLCHKCSYKAQKHITDYKAERTKKLDIEINATPRKKYMKAAGLNDEHRDVYIGPQTPYKKSGNNGKLEELQTENRNLERKVSLLSSQLDEINELKHKSDLSYEEMESSLKTLEKKSEKMKEKSDDLQREKDELQKEKDEMQKKLRTLEWQIDKAKTRLSEEQCDWEKKLESVNHENMNLKTKLDTLEDSNSQLKNEISEKQTHVEHLHGENEKLHKKNHELSNMSEEKERINLDLVSKLHDRKKANQELQKIMEEALDKNSSQEKSLRELETKVRIMQEEKESKDKELEKLKKAKPPLVVGVRTLGSGLTPTISNMIVAELSRLIRGSFKSDNIEVTIKQCTVPNEVPNGPLVVLCLTQTRIGSNVKEALDGIEASHDVVILVLHHKEQEQTSSIYPTKSRIGGSFPKVGDILDMVFLDERGIYDCDFNAETLHNLTSILSKYVNRL